MAPKGSKVAPAKGKSGDKKKKAHSKPKSAAERDAARGDQIENLADKLQASAAKREQKQKSKRKRKNKKNVFTKYWERMFGADEEIRLNPCVHPGHGDERPVDCRRQMAASRALEAEAEAEGSRLTRLLPMHPPRPAARPKAW